MMWWRENWSRCRAIGIEDILELYGISSGKSGAYEEQDIVNSIESWLTSAYPNLNGTKRGGTRHYTFKDSELLTEIMLAAAEREQTVIVKFILAQSAKFHPLRSLDKSQFSGRFPHLENPKVIEVLLQEGLQQSETMLVQATQEGNLPVLKILVENGGDIHADYDYDSKKLVHFAAEENQLEIIKYLIARGANINSHYGPPFDITPLDHAIWTESKSMVDLLLKAGADPNSHRIPAVHVAAEDDKASMLIYLCDHYELDIEQVEVKRSGRRPIHYAISYSFQACECLRFLIDRDVNINAQDYEGRTPLHLARRKLFADPMKILLEAGADIDLVANTGETPFTWDVKTASSNNLRYRREVDTYALLATHIAKKLTAGLYVRAENQQKFQNDSRCDVPQYQRVFEDIEAAKRGWEEEIELMKRCKFHGSSTVYDLLESRSTSAYSKDPFFMRALETFNHDQFPHYKSILKGKINEERKKPGLWSRL